MTEPSADLVADERATRARLAAAQADLDRIIGAGQDVATDDEHDPEGIGLALERAHAVAAVDRAHAHLARIHEALGRVGRGDYGVCEGCGERIPVDRLEALPTATTCTACSANRSSRMRRGPR